MGVEVQVAYDLEIDGTTGDLVFAPSRDLAGVSGSALTKQRILIRCKVPRATWLYDSDGTFGSDLYKISNAPGPSQLAQAPALVHEALMPMDDIKIDDVQVGIDSENRLSINVLFSDVNDQVSGVETDADDTTVTI